MTKRGALSWCWMLGALVLAASCAQGSADNAVDAGSATPGDATVPQPNAEAGSADTGGSNSVGNDSGPNVGNDSAPPSEDSGPGLDAAADAGEDSGPTAEDAGVDSSPGTDAGLVIPTDCSQAYQTTGCCAGNVLYYCLAGSSTLTIRACTGTKVCGWGGSYYDCVSPPATSGAGHPIVCK
jgi:hypothetical protein